MSNIIAAAVVAAQLFAVPLRFIEPQPIPPWMASGPAYRVQATTLDSGDTRVTISLPAKDNIWTCIIMRRNGDDSWLPRWCGGVEQGQRTLIDVLPGWPPADMPDGWEVSGFVQWRDRPDQMSDFGYAEPEPKWSQVTR